MCWFGNVITPSIYNYMIISIKYCQILFKDILCVSSIYSMFLKVVYYILTSINHYDIIVKIYIIYIRKIANENTER